MTVKDHDRFDEESPVWQPSDLWGTGFPRLIESPITAAKIIELAGLSEASLTGPPDQIVTGVAALSEGRVGTFAFCNRRGAKASEMISEGAATLIAVYEGVQEIKGYSFICTDDPKHVFVRVVSQLFPDTLSPHPFPPGATIASEERFPGVIFGANTVIHPDVEIGAGSHIGNNVVIYAGTRIGQNCIISDGCIIGGNGISFTKNVDGGWETFPHLGRVLIGDFVGIGQNSAIQRGLLKNTVLEDGVKTGALVNIAHNCYLGRESWLSAGVTLCGSIVMEPDVFVGAGAVLNNHLRIGQASKIAAAAFVVRDVVARTCVLGSPAKPVPFLSRF